MDTGTLQAAGHLLGGGAYHVLFLLEKFAAGLPPSHCRDVLRLPRHPPHYPGSPPRRGCLRSHIELCLRLDFTKSRFNAWEGYPPWPSPPAHSNAHPPPRRARTFFFAPLLTRREKNWGVSNAQGVEGPHFFCTVAGIGQGGGEGNCRPVFSPFF